MDALTQSQITQLFYSNRTLFRKGNATHIGIWPGGRISGINYRAQQEALDRVHESHWTWSRCYVMSQFVFYFLGGYESDWDLKCIKGIPFSISGVDGTTSHWFVQNRQDDSIIDLSVEQFRGLLNINEWYVKGRRSNLGFPHYYGRTRNTKLSINGKCVPSKECLKFYEVWRDQYGINESFERYYKVFSTRMKQNL